MILSAQLRAVVRCARCGDVVGRDFNLFALGGGRALAIHCECGQELLRVRRHRRKGWTAEVTCAVCNRPHGLALSSAGLLAGEEVAALFCPWTDVELGFVGPPAAVGARAEPWAQELARASEYAKMEAYPVSRGTLADLLGFLHHLTQDGKLSSLHESRSADPWDVDS